MSDDQILAALARLETGQADMSERLSRVETRMVAVEAEQTRLREQLNNKLDDILDKMPALRTDADTTRAHVLYGLQENLTLSQRISKLEDEMRRR
jgi:hypothetical protein